MGIKISILLSVKNFNDFIPTEIEKNAIKVNNALDYQTNIEGIYAIGVLAGHRSQLSIAAGSGASAATDILTLWNDGKPVQVHDAVNK